ncbi:hypothetical protein [Pseudomonas sp.]|jgi:hypothetical protein|uniref:hypothetical protein n=1 Tax=Pseudomonas sp. TaxID=306 RepID=UPI002E35046F|nr:hypothetical protein [Pseudomonas sp.]HEX4549918.1 hypothetical protein [Pseudomonas sp.]
MSVHQLRPSTNCHRFDAGSADFTKSALVNLLDGFQRIKQVSNELSTEDVTYVETALYTACLYIAYSHPRSSKKRLARQLMTFQAANTAGGVQ